MTPVEYPVAVLEQLQRPTGTTAILSGGGTAFVSDPSAADANPANLANTRELTVTGFTSWQASNIVFNEAAVLDGAMSEITAVLKARQLTTYGSGGGKHRRFTLAAGERLGGGGPLALGAGLDYYRLEPTPAQVQQASSSKKSEDHFRARFGINFALGQSLQIGARSDGYFDSKMPKVHAAGLSYSAGNGAYVLTLDAIHSTDTKSTSTIGGILLGAKDYLDLGASYGYEPSSEKKFWAWGVTVKSQQARLFYAMVKQDFRSSELRHHFGLTLALGAT